MDKTQHHSGRRIRAARRTAGLTQAALADASGISASYLNLIEYERRPIAGRLLAQVSAALGVTSERLTEGVSTEVLSALEAASDMAGFEGRTEASGEIAEAFPGWTAVIARLSQRCAELEAEGEGRGGAEEMSAQLHDLISAVTSIRASASILAESGEIGRDWQQRFAGNIHAEALRLEEQSQGLVDRLAPATAREKTAPRFGLDRALAEGPIAEAQPVIEAFAERGVDVASLIAQRWAAVLEADRQAVPQDLLTTFASDVRDPFALAVQLGLEPDRVLRRLALTNTLDRPSGMVVVDRAGAIVLSAPPSGFIVPERSAPCALWPIFDALAQPGEPISRRIEMPGGAVGRFACHALSTRRLVGGAGQPTLTEATMLILGDAREAEGILRAGPTCAFCPQPSCAARREPARSAP